MGMALTALAGELLPEHTTHDAARTLAVRHAGIVVALLALAPVVAHQLDVATEHAQRAGRRARARRADRAASRSSPWRRRCSPGVDAQDPRDGLQPRRRGASATASRARELAAYDRLGKRADETLIAAVADAFHVAFLVTGALGLLAALARRALARPAPRGTGARGRRSSSRSACPAAYAVLHHQLAPAAGADPRPVHRETEAAADRRPRRLPPGPGAAPARHDRVPYHATREELVLALTSDADAKRFEEEHGVDPRKIGGLLRTLLGG